MPTDGPVGAPAAMQDVDGVLICSSLAAGVPAGAWSASCSPVSYNGTVLTAYCGLFFANGTARVSRIDTALCTADSSNQIDNEYGVLTCVGTSAPTPPGGQALPLSSV